MEFFSKLFDLLRHLGEDEKWRAMVDYTGVHSLYFILFAIVFCETGLVVTPFLPGDSLIFAVGAVAGREIGLELWVVGLLLVCAALLGDNVNYWLGRRVGPAIFKREEITEQGAPIYKIRFNRLLNKKHLTQAQAFYENYGSKTIILARFVPIVRTFAPFVAGIGKMNYARFLIFSVIGAVAWVSICLGAGYTLGSRPFFKTHFELVILAIVAISVIPVIIEFLKARRAMSSAHLEPAASGETINKH